MTSELRTGMSARLPVLALATGGMHGEAEISHVRETSAGREMRDQPRPAELLVAVMHQGVRPNSDAPDTHCQVNIRSELDCHRPPNHVAQQQIECRSQIDPAFLSSYVSKISNLQNGCRPKLLYSILVGDKVDDWRSGLSRKNLSRSLCKPMSLRTKSARLPSLDNKLLFDQRRRRCSSKLPSLLACPADICALTSSLVDLVTAMILIASS
jgi:hypothetical protein